MKEQKWKQLFDYEPFDKENEEQLKAYKTLWLDSETRKYYKYFTTFSTFEEFIEKQSENIYFVKFEDYYIGWVRYILQNAYRKEYEILYIVSPEFREHGYGKRIVKDFTDYLKNEKEANTLSAIVEHDNYKSKAILEKYGFQLQKTIPACYGYGYYEWKKNPKN